jgi:hypothetical protein
VDETVQAYNDIKVNEKDLTAKERHLRPVGRCKATFFALAFKRK